MGLVRGVIQSTNQMAHSTAAASNGKYDFNLYRLLMIISYCYRDQNLFFDCNLNWSLFTGMQPMQTSVNIQPSVNVQPCVNVQLTEQHNISHIVNVSDDTLPADEGWFRLR